jgi:hypothetical protein
MRITMDKMVKMANLDLKVLQALFQGQEDRMVSMEKMDKKDKMLKILICF